MQPAMSFSLALNRTHNVLLVTFGKQLAREQHQEMVAAVRTLVARHGNFDAIADFSAVEAFGLDFDYLRLLAQARPVLTGQKRVLVAPGDNIFGSLRVFATRQAMAGDEPQVVRSLAEAFEHLGIDAPDFQPVPRAD
jgi:hypothetical protein